MIEALETQITVLTVLVGLAAISFGVVYLQATHKLHA